MFEVERGLVAGEVRITCFGVMGEGGREGGRVLVKEGFIE